MKAIGYSTATPPTETRLLQDIELPTPTPRGRDLLVEVRAISVNPVDTKVRQRPSPTATAFRVIGWDAAGVVAAIGPDVQDFATGDAVYYAGAIDRPGSNVQMQLIDERIVAPKPQSLDWAQAAALPLTAITAWEVLFDRLTVDRPVPGGAHAILVIGGAGGVASMAVQLARARTDLTVIATASRPQTEAWVRDLGAHHVIDHGKPLPEQIEALGLGQPSFVFITTHSARHLPQVPALIAPQGRVGLIDDDTGLDIAPLKAKSLSIHYEMMFTRSMLQTADMGAQGLLLRAVAGLVDAGRIRTTLSERLSPITAANLEAAHAAVAEGSMLGKFTLEGWPQD